MDQFNQNCCDVLAQLFLNGLNSINTINSNSNRNTNSAYIHCPLDAQYSNLCLMLEKQYWLIWSEPDKNTSRLGPLIRPNTSHTHTHTHTHRHCTNMDGYRRVLALTLYECSACVCQCIVCHFIALIN